MIESNILKALQTAVIAAVAASDDDTLAVKCMGRTLTGTDQPTKYLEILYIPNNLTNEFWDTGKTYQGIMRLILHWPMEDKGAYEPLRLLESIVESLPKGSTFTYDDETVRLTDEPNLLSVIEEAPEMLFPVSLRYQLFKP